MLSEADESNSIKSYDLKDDLQKMMTDIKYRKNSADADFLQYFSVHMIFNPIKESGPNDRKLTAKLHSNSEQTTSIGKEFTVVVYSTSNSDQTGSSKTVFNKKGGLSGRQGSSSNNGAEDFDSYNEHSASKLAFFCLRRIRMNY